MSNAHEIPLFHGAKSAAAAKLGVSRQWYGQMWEKRHPKAIEAMREVMAEFAAIQAKKKQDLEAIKDFANVAAS